MKSKNVYFHENFKIIFYIIFLGSILLIQSKLKCEPDFKSYGDNYNCDQSDYQDSREYFYGYEFAHRAGKSTNDEYYDKWKGIYWDAEQFCYKAYTNDSRPANLDDLRPYTKIDEINVISNNEDPPNGDYVMINHEDTNLVDLHKIVCKTDKMPPSNFSYGDYELLLRMDKTFEDNYLKSPHHFYFTIENPSNENVTFAFKVRNFVNTTEEMYANVSDWIINQDCVTTTPATTPPTTSPATTPSPTPTNPADDADKNNTSDDPDITEPENVPTTEPEKVPTTEPATTEPPCEWYILNYTDVFWSEEYAIPEVFYLTENYTIEPHSSMKINLSLTFKENDNISEKGYFVISSETGQSDKPFYWPKLEKGNGKLEKLTNMEIILESDNEIGLSTYSLMRRRDLETDSYLGKECNKKKENEKDLNGVCGDGFFCKSNKCEKCERFECKECKDEDGVCTQCFSISVEGQWNPRGGRANSLACDLDYIDIAKVEINEGKGIEVPPAIHWRVTMDFWIWISDASVLIESGTNMNIIYKDFMAITLRCTQDGLRIFATPIEWLYEYPTCDEHDEKKRKSYYEKYIQTINSTDIIEFLKETVGSYNKVTMEDLVKNQTANWIYVRFAFNLDSSKQYLDDLPESNLKIPQLYTTQTKMPFHMKKFYGYKNMTKLYFQNFHRPLSKDLLNKGTNITIYFRNLNIFREYIPQNIVTKYYNLHKFITKPLEFPQLMISMPFSGVKKKNPSSVSDRIYEMEGYNYYIRSESDGVVIETNRETTKYKLEFDKKETLNGKTIFSNLRPPRNFWRLNLIDEGNKQPETCDFAKFIKLKCNTETTDAYCFEDDKPFVCEDGTEERPYYLDIFNLKCQPFCELGYMHPPRYSQNKKRLYCSHLCDTGNNQCPSDDYKYTDIHSNFLCSNNFFNLYYKCFHKDELINNIDNGGIFFSSFLWTPSIYIDLRNPDYPSGYTQFAIDFWYYPDDRLRNKRYLDLEDPIEKDYNPKNHVKPDKEKKRILFWSDCCKVIYGEKGRIGNGMIKFYSGGGETSKYAENNVVSYNWNHFVLVYFYALKHGGYVYYLTLTNDQFYNGGESVYVNYGNWAAPANVILSEIIFCTFDDKVDYARNDKIREGCKTAEWLDGFYTKLQIFDLTYSAKNPIFFAHEFADDGLNNLLKHRYIFGVKSVIDNSLQDLVGGKHGYVRWVNNLIANQNPDGTNYILYEVNYSPQSGISDWGNSKYVSDYEYKAPELELKGQTSSDIKCHIFQSSNRCLECNPGYSLFSKTCKGEANEKTTRATYFYKNPGINMPERVSLNLDFDKMINTPYFTFFFFIKIYGFVKGHPEGNEKLIIFHEVKDAQGNIKEQLYLGWTPNTQDPDLEKLFFHYNGARLYSYPYYREYHFGEWSPISLAAFRESDKLFQTNMVQCSIHYKNLGFDKDYDGDYFPYIKFTQFSITNTWVGLLSDVRVYNRFIANAWGIIRHAYQTVEVSKDDIPDSAVNILNLKSENEDNCLLLTQILNKPAAGYKVQCVADYNPHFYEGCDSMEAQTVRYHQGDGYYGLCTATCGTNGWALNRCLGGHDAPGNYYYDDQSCESQSPVWKNWFPSIGTDHKIQCSIVHYIDYNRFKYAYIKNVYSPQDVWAIDFWFYTGTCHALIKRTSYMNWDNLDKTNNNNNNFKEFVVEWNYHIRIRVYTVKETDDPNLVDYNYYVDCTPIIVLEHPDLDSPEIYSNNLGRRHYRWSYVTCGVNFQEKLFYQTNKNRFSSDMPFTSKLVVIPSARTSFVLNEKSPSGYGFTFIKQMRLWHCYNCAHSFRNLDYQKYDLNFNAVYHNFDGHNSGGAGPTQSFYDEAGNCTNYVMTQAADFPGYTVRYGYGGPVLCDETLYNYYNEETDSCERHFNLARIRKPEDFYRNIPSSRNARYSMDFWFFVENSAELSPGFNLLWDYHMSITLLRDTSNKNTINAICFPQSYRDNVDNKGGQEIIDLYDKALNKDKYAFYQGSSIWNFVRCSVDQTRKVFFINDNIQLDLEGEILYGTQRNYRPFRYFKINSYHKLKFQNAHLNPTRLFIRQVRCYKDYIDFRLMEMRFLKCSSRWSTCQFWPLTFCFDFGEIDKPNWPCTDSRTCFACYPYADCGLVYYIFKESSEQTVSYEFIRWRLLLRLDEDIYYPTFPDIYLPKFCDHGQKGGDKIKCEEVGPYNCRMQNSTAYFWPDTTGMYLDLNSLSQVNPCVDACRLPDTYLRRAYCQYEKDRNNMLNCAYETNKYSPYSAGYNNYYEKFECKPGYTQVYYECIDNNIIKYSAMYFSNVYSFPNVVFSASDKSRETLPYEHWKVESRLASYYVEAWIKFDTLNYRNEITEIEHYLYAHPHQIIKDPIDQKYKYSNLLISQGSYYYTLTSMQNYEWNKIIIENSYDPDTKLFQIRFFLNYEFDNPEVEILNLDSEIYKLHFRGFGFCDKADSYCRINNEPAYLRWGVAWYRNFRVWDADITSLELIQACEYGYTQLINAQKYYFPLTVDYIQRNTILDRIDSTNSTKMQLNYWIFYQENDYKSAFDDAMRENYSTENFDKTFMEENNYISGINDDGTDYLISACADECKRCYSSSNVDCYECRLGYAIYGKQCKVRTGYFLKTPPENTGIKEINITVYKNDDTYFNIEEINPLTITLYIKFFGIELSKVVRDKVHYPLVYFYKDPTNPQKDELSTYIGYNYDEKSLEFVIKNKTIYIAKAKPYIGIWTHFGVSIHHQNGRSEFPNMLNFMIDQKELIPYLGFDPTTTEVKINSFIIHTYPICYYSSFKVFSSFYFGPYGHVNAIASTRGSKLVYQINLYGSSSSNCITDADLFDKTMNTKILRPVCVSDYHPYEDSNNICSDDDHYMDVIFKTNPPCELCDSICITNCFNKESSECTCDYYEGLYWVKTDKEYQSYECQKVDSINFAFFEKVTLLGLTVVKNDEMTMAFWLDIYEYIKNSFEQLNVIWNRHIAVIVKHYNDINMLIECHGDYDIESTDSNIGQTITTDIRPEFNKWTYVVCQADKFHKFIRLNAQQNVTYTPVSYGNKILTTSLTIEDKTSNFNYGFSFVRELKLFSSFNFDFWDESLHNLQRSHFEYLLHSFSNRFSGDKISDSKITDAVEGLVTKLTLKSDRIGYNYVIDYKYLVICEEGYVYNNVTNKCDIFDSTICAIPRTFEEKCLLCGSQHPYLKDNDTCYKDCSPDYYADEYFKQCRRCDYTCHTCFGKYHNNCLSCVGIYYYIESLHVCITNCQEYGLIISTKKNNTCEELITESHISIPVYLNNSYDYNPSNEDFVSKIVNRDFFNEIEGHVDFVTSEYSTLWIFNWNKTIELNRKYRYFDMNDIPDEDPINSDPSQLKISVENSFFKYGYHYVFDLEIYSRNGNFSTNNTHTYILMMNDYPLVGQINILPSKGYITNLFLMTINKCKDDVTEKKDLRYKFTYFTKKADIIDGYTTDPETKEEEILIQDWSSNSEVLYKFPELNPEEGNKYYIRGYCRDKWGLFYSEIQEVEVYDVPTNSRVDIPLEDALESIDIDEDLTPEQLSNRAEFLATTTIDFEKGIEILNRTNVTDFTKRGIWQQNLILYDPTSSPNDIYCNYRGNSYVEYYYLICDCNGYEGGMCQIDHPSFEKVIQIYKDLFTKVKTMQTIHYNHYLINAVNLLMRSGAAFMPIENMDFMLESIEFINLYRNKFAAEMMEGTHYETYFDIYNSLIEYGLSIVNKLKYRNFIAANSKNAENLYNIERFRNATLNKGQPKTVQSYFNKIKVSLQSLLEFYATNRKEIRFINRNINVYVALVNENFGFNSYFNIEKKLYEPYMNFQRCLETTMIQSQGNPSYRIFMTAIMWKVSPYMSGQELYWDTASPIISFKFIDYDKGEKIYLSDCGDEDNQVQLYFPLNTYRLVERINRQRDYLSPEKQYDMNDDIFCDPVYINKSGAVFNSTPEERIQQFWLGFNFSCQYYKVSPEDQEDISLTNETLDYHLYTKENYVQCLAKKLVQEAYGEFVVQYYILPSDFHVNSRFFYLKHYMLLFWKENYNKNQAFYYFIAVAAFYVVMSLAYIYFEKNHVVQMQKLASLKTEIAKINMPYRDEYIFNNDLNLEDEIRGKLKDKRKPDMEEMNLDTNNLNVNIMADEIGRYNKGYKNQDNALGFNPNFFGIKDKTKTNVNSKFFPGEVDIRQKPNLDDEISPERLEKMKQFYQVGFKGLDSNEKRRKEMKLADDKKKVVVGKNEDLEEISEGDELSFDNNRGNFFKRDEEEDEKETHINIHKKKKKKFAENMKSYQDYVSNTEDLGTEANLKSSRRETATKKFFGHNPPKKGEKGPIMSSLIFSEKDQQKKGRKDAAFFGNKLDEPQKNVRKERNIFQKEYDNIYKPNFKGPKVVSENLGFYNNMDTIDFEQEMDNNENKNPPFFGKRFRKKRVRDDEDRGKGENAGMRVGFMYKNRQIDLEDTEEQLPKLEVNLTFEREMEEFHSTSCSFTNFLVKNIKSRHILLTTFDRFSIVYERYQRAGNFSAQLSMFAFFNSIFFTADAQQVAYETGNKDQILNFILYCFLSDVASCIVLHLPAYCFWINIKKFRKLYNTIREDGGITALKENEEINTKGRLFWKILGVIIQIIYILGGFYFAFGFCATYYYQRTTFILALICTMLLDFFIAEFAWEIFIALLYYFRDVGRIIVFFGTLFNKLRNIKHLV